MLEKIGKFLQGKKTYVTVVAIIVVSILKHYGVEVPDVVWGILGAAGLGFVRSGVGKVVKE